MRVSVFPGLGQTNAINDRGMIQLIRKHSIFLPQQDFKQPCIGIKTAGVENGILLPMEGCYFCLQLSVNVLQGRDM